jgi:hypothetical protein
LAFALDSTAKDIDYKTNPEVRLSSCTWYTPDFIIGNRLIVEVDVGFMTLITAKRLIESVREP